MMSFDITVGFFYVNPVIPDVIFKEGVIFVKKTPAHQQVSFHKNLGSRMGLEFLSDKLGGIAYQAGNFFDWNLLF